MISNCTAFGFQARASRPRPPDVAGVVAGASLFGKYSISAPSAVSDCGYMGSGHTRRSQGLGWAASQASPEMDATVGRLGGGCVAFDGASPMPDARLPIDRRGAQPVDKQQRECGGQSCLCDAREDIKRGGIPIC
jgi:hypothetical protein